MHPEPMAGRAGTPSAAGTSTAPDPTVPGDASADPASADAAPPGDIDTAGTRATTARRPEARRSFGHHPALDGLRGLAILLVLLNHSGIGLWSDAEPWLAPGGALGVHLFFVLSGLLIASLLLGEQARTGGIDLRAFAGRRVRRLVPTLVVLLVALAAAALVLDHLVLRDVASSAAYVLTFTANWSAVGFPLAPLERAFGGGTMVVETLQTWSLAIEVHFYLLWSLALWAAVRRGWSHRRMAVATALAIAVIAGVRAASYAGGTDWFTLYASTYSRLDAALVGTLVGIAYMAGWLRPSRGLTAAGWAGLAALLVMAVVDDGSSPALPLGLYTVLAGGAAAGMAAVLTDPTSRLGRVLTMRWLMFLGTVSYSVYLWHQGVFLLFQLHAPSWAGPVRLVVGVTVALLVSTASYHLVERRFMRRRSAA